MIRSSMPSPSTSPAPLTESPEWSSAAAPWMIRSAPRGIGEVDGRRKALIAAEHHIAGAGIRTAVRVGTKAPMIRSSMPSPLTSPAPLTELPDMVIRRGALDDQVGVAREVDGRRKALIGAEHHIAGAGSHGRSGRPRGADDQIVDAIAIDVARPAHREAGKSLAAAPWMIRSASLARSMVAGKP